MFDAEELAALHILHCGQASNDTAMGLTAARNRS